MAGVIGGSLAKEAATVNGVVVGGMVGDVAEGATAAALRWVVYWGLLEPVVIDDLVGTPAASVFETSTITRISVR